MEQKATFDAVGTNLVYVKSVAVADLPQEVQQEAGDRSELFAVHDAQGEQLALVADRNLAYSLAIQNDMVPVTVH